jgi:hypothetical protein
MAKIRPFGIKLIAAYFWIKGSILLLAGLTAHMRPDVGARANTLIFHLAPSIQQLQQVPVPNSYIAWAGVLFAVAEVVKGLGIWFLQKWARTFIVVTIVLSLGDAMAAAAFLWGMDRPMLMSIVGTPYFPAGLLLSFFILYYLLDPDVKAAFGPNAGIFD